MFDFIPQTKLNKKCCIVDETYDLRPQNILLSILLQSELSELCAWFSIPAVLSQWSCFGVQYCTLDNSTLHMLFSEKPFFYRDKQERKLLGITRKAKSSIRKAWPISMTTKSTRTRPAGKHMQPKLDASQCSSPFSDFIRQNTSVKSPKSIQVEWSLFQAAW